MSASSSTIGRYPTASVAIIGNDALLAAAPATPVQIAHACLRRGFSVAVPASWGDELLATEALRRLGSMERGPAVMCVCPFVRSRLLAPGPDLAPFLVSLVSPPVAVARYLRTLYGEAGVQLTYVGGCPGADDPVIDIRLTPDAFMADLAEHQIALSEQPLVFDSIVPPDRRRWCSLPGGVPTAEALWSEADTRTLIEIDRDDASTDLAQHIITREPVLLDLAPSLGCVCSGAVGGLPPRSARVAVTTLEPPRALGPVMDPAAVFSLDVPVGAPAGTPPSGAASGHRDVTAEHLDAILGSQTNAPIPEPEREPDTEIDLTLAMEIMVPIPEVAPEPPDTTASEPAPMSLPITGAANITAATEPAVAETPVTDSDESATAVSEDVAPAPPRGPSTQFGVRRDTPVPTAVRHLGTSVPRAMASDGRPLPRAYIAKRRTPPVGVAPVRQPAADVDAHVSNARPPLPEQSRDQWPNEPPPPGAAEPESAPTTQSPAPNAAGGEEPAPMAGAEPGQIRETVGVETLVVEPAVTEAVNPEAPATEAPAADQASSPPFLTSSLANDQPAAGTAGPSVDAPRTEPARGGAATVSDNNPSALVVLLVALLALGFFVLRSLNQ